MVIEQTKKFFLINNSGHKKCKLYTSCMLASIVLYGPDIVSCHEVMIDFFIFILLSRERHEGAMHRTNPDSLRGATLVS